VRSFRVPEVKCAWMWKASCSGTEAEIPVAGVAGGGALALTSGTAAGMGTPAVTHAVVMATYVTNGPAEGEAPRRLTF
jgi:hypothetical protein